MRRVRAVWDRERTSVKNKTPSHWFMAGWDPSLALSPPLGHLPLPSASTIPAIVLRGRESPAWHDQVLSAGGSPGLGYQVRRQTREEPPKCFRVHTATHSRGWLWCSFQKPPSSG